MDFLPGLVSVTFRHLSPQQVLEACRMSGLRAVEWGGDVHVPVGDLERAEEVRLLTRLAGIKTVCYGSYWRAGQGQVFGPVLETAWTLGAPKIRVWAGVKGSDLASEAEFESCVADMEAAALLSSVRGIRVTVEIHPDTLTDSPDSAFRLLDRLEGRVDCHWQPSPRLSFAENCDLLGRVRFWTKGFHVFYWQATGAGIDRLPLSEGWDDWREYLAFAEEGSHPLLLEFVKGDDPVQLERDASELMRWIKQWEAPP